MSDLVSGQPDALAGFPTPSVFDGVLGGSLASENGPGDDRPFRVVSDFEPAGDQPEAIAELAEGITRGDRFQTLLGITGSGKSATIAWTIEQVQKPDADHRPQQVPGRPAGQRVPGVLPRQPGRVLRLLLRLLPARGLHPVERHLHREGLLDQRRDRPAPPLGHLGAADPAGRHRGGRCRCIYGLGSPEEYREPDPRPVEPGERLRPAGHPAPPGRHAVRAQRHEPGARQVPGAGRHHRGPPGLRGDRGPHRAVRRRDRAHHASSTRSPARCCASSTSSSIFPATHYVAGDERMRRPSTGIEDELQERLAYFETRGQAARGPAPAHAHPVRPRDDGRGRLLQRHRELQPCTSTAASRARRPTPCSTSSPRTSCSSSTSATSGRAAAARPVRGRPLPQGDPRSSTASGCRRPPTTGRCASTSSTSGSTSASSCRPPRAPTSSAVRPRWSSRSCGRPAWSTPRSIVKPTKGQIDDLIEQINRADREGRPGAGHHPHQEDGRGPHRLPARAWASGSATCTATSTPSSASRSSATCASASSTCWSASTCCGRASTCPRSSLVAILDADKEGFLRARPRSSRPSAGRPATSTAR